MHSNVHVLRMSRNVKECDGMSSAGRCVKVVGMKVELMKCKDVECSQKWSECMIMCLGRNATHSGQKCHLFRGAYGTYYVVVLFG